MTGVLELLGILWRMALLWGATIALVAAAVAAGDVAAWVQARRRARRVDRVADLEAELADTLDELVAAHRRIAVLEARCVRLAVDAVWPGGDRS